MIKTSSLIKQLSESSQNLSEENKKIFDDIIIYIRTSNIKIRDQEEFLQQILDSFLNAEQKGISIESMLGTSDIRQYCNEIVHTYKSSYNILSLSGDYVMFSGIFVLILSSYNFINKIITMLLSKKLELNNLSFSVDINLELIFQFLIIVPLVFVVMILTRKSCFKEPTKVNKVKDFFILWIVFVLLICVMIAIGLHTPKMVFFSLNIIIVLIIGAGLYLSGNYLSQK